MRIRGIEALAGGSGEAVKTGDAVAPLTRPHAEPFVANQDLVAHLAHNWPRSVAPRAFHDVLRGLPR